MIIYQILSVLLSPIIDLYLLIRRLNLKEDEKRIRERFGFASQERPQRKLTGKLIWVHAASVGESNSIFPLINSLLEKNHHIHILFTSGTVTSATEISKKLPKRTIHQFIPIDKLTAVRRFISHWQPDLAIFVESEIWPNLVNETKKSGCQLILVNGRISEKSFGRWKLLHKIGFNILKNFNVIFAQSKKDQKRFQNLGLKNIHYFGNLKSITSAAKIDEEKLNELKKMIGNRKIWLSSSTHRGEEEIILKTHLQLQKKFPEILTILVPRHPIRKDEILSLIDPKISVAIRSEGNKITKETEIYLADTMGELPIFYTLSPISFIGGSLLPGIGGHTPFEAMKYGSSILSGEFTANFEEIYEDLEKENSCLIVKNENDLTKKIKNLIEDEKSQTNLLKNIEKSLLKNQNILENITKEIAKYF